MILANVLGQSPQCSAQGKLSHIRDAARVKDAPSEDRGSTKDDDEEHGGFFFGTSSSSDHHGHHDDDDDSLENAIGSALVIMTWYTVTSPFWTPPEALGDDGSITGYFARSPYYENVPGYMMLEHDIRSTPRSWSGRARVEYGSDLDDIDRIGGHLLLSTSSRLGFDLEWNSFEEKTATGTDQLRLGDVNLIYRFAQSERMQWRTGIGLTWLDDDIDTEYGFNFTYGADWYPCKPVVVSSALDWGTIGEDDRFHIRTSAGIIYYGMELYVGYDFNKIGGIDIYGPMAGVRVWF